jgi:hypothetical protein
LLPRVVESFLARGMRPDTALLRALLAIDQYVKGKPVGEAMTGTAAVVALICTHTASDREVASRVHRIWVANVGDCRAVVAVPQDADRWEVRAGGESVGTHTPALSLSISSLSLTSQPTMMSSLDLTHSLFPPPPRHYCAEYACATPPTARAGQSCHMDRERRRRCGGGARHSTGCWWSACAGGGGLA